ncbi:MAG TPA: helix-turn-helix domain-containing protein [Rubrobacteraceae bacterium]|jgi:excisionase family DNA binding protein|nr:helix-turn-helix domain-containing protein [Rubrobacteraceae bacterium]
MKSTKELLTVPEVAEYLSIGRSRAYEMVKAGEIPSLKLSPRRTQVRIQDLEQRVISKQGDGGKEEK